MSETAELHRDRVDQERHVVGHEHHHGVSVLPPVDVDARVEYGDLGRAALPVGRELRVLCREPEQVLDRTVREVVLVDVREIGAEEGLVESGAGAAGGTRVGDDVLDCSRRPPGCARVTHRARR